MLIYSFNPTNEDGECPLVFVEDHIRYSPVLDQNGDNLKIKSGFRMGFDLRPKEKAPCGA